MLISEGFDKIKLMIGVFKTKKIKTKTVGDELKNTRESRKMTLRQISDKTKIPVVYLEDLENSNYEKLPADVYITAYLKKYTQLLNLNSNKIIEQFKRERSLTDNSTHSSNKDKRFLSIMKKPFLVTPKKLTLILALLAICLIFGFFWNQVSYLLYPPFIELEKPASNFTITDYAIEVVGQTEPSASLTINGKEVLVNKEGYFNSKITLESGLNMLTIEAKDKFGRTNTLIRKIMVIEK